MTDCPDAKGAATGLPDLAGLTADINEACAPTTYWSSPWARTARSRPA